MTPEEKDEKNKPEVPLNGSALRVGADGDGSEDSKRRCAA